MEHVLYDTKQHYIRMREFAKYVGLHNKSIKPDYTTMLNSIGENWFEEYCPLCQKYKIGQDCGNCPFNITGLRCDNINSPWWALNDSETWSEFAVNCDTMISIINELLEKRQERGKMITKITDETTVKEILEVLNWMGKCNNYPLCSLRIYSDSLGNFYSGLNNVICDTRTLPKYISKRQKIENLQSLSETELKEYITEPTPKTKNAKQYLKDGRYDLPIGTKFIYKNEKYIVLFDSLNFTWDNCNGCDVFPLFNLCKKIQCKKTSRKDCKSVIIKKI